MWELDHKEGWELKNWCFWTVVLGKTLESPLDCKEIQPVHPKGNQPWIFTGKTDTETPVLWSPDAKSWLIRKDPDTGKDWRQEEKGTTEDEMVGTTNSMYLSFSKLQDIVKDREASCASVHGMAESQTWLSDWKTTKTYSRILKIKPSYSSQYPVLRYHLKSLYSWHLSFLVSLFPYFPVHSLPTPFFSLFPSNSSLWPLEWLFHGQQTFLHTQLSHNLLTPVIFPWLLVTSILLTPFSLVSHITDKNCIGGNDDCDCCQIITWY